MDTSQKKDATVQRFTKSCAERRTDGWTDDDDIWEEDDT